MQLTEIKESVKCTLGDCKRGARYALQVKKSGIRSRIYLCRECAVELYCELQKAFVPKSIETMRPKRAKEN